MSGTTEPAVPANARRPPRRLGPLVFVGAALVVVGVVLAVALGVLGTGGSSAPKVPAISGGDVTLAGAGDYAIYYQGGSSGAPDPAVQVVGPDLMVVPVRNPAGGSSGGPSGRVVGECTDTGAGRCRVQAGGAAAAVGELRITKADSATGQQRALGAGIGVLVAALGLVLLIVGLGRRR